jgi:regulator of sigma E protease
MVDESMDKDQMAQPPKEDEFRSKPAWQRLIVMIAGVTVNVILGFFIYIMVVAAWGDNVVSNDTLKYGVAVDKNFAALNLGIEDGDIITAVDGEKVENANLVNLQIFLRGYRELEVQKPSGEKKIIVLDKDIDDWMWENDAVMAFNPRMPTVVDSVMENRDAFTKGLTKGDSIVKINGVETPFFHELQAELNKQEGDSTIATVGLYRNGEYLELDIYTDANKTIGFQPQFPEWLNSTHNDYTFGESITKGIQKAGWTLHDYAAQLPLIFTAKGAKNVGGFGAIGNLFPAAWDWQIFWANTAFLSMALAIMNILPIPALDGGHIIFLLYEMITGKEAPQKVLEYAQLIGFVFLITLFLYINGNDVYRAFFK